MLQATRLFRIPESPISESFNPAVGGWVVDGIVAATAFLAFHSLAHDDVARVDHVAEFADVLVNLRAEEELLGLFVEDIEACPGALETELRADDADVGLHDLLHFDL